MGKTTSRVITMNIIIDVRNLIKWGKTDERTNEGVQLSIVVVVVVVGKSIDVVLAPVVVAGTTDRSEPESECDVDWYRLCDMECEFEYRCTAHILSRHPTSTRYSDSALSRGNRVVER